ncbi:hypothetical protein BH10PSE15_BH10PSE15_02470 [soil metagenome]
MAHIPENWFLYLAAGGAVFFMLTLGWASIDDARRDN